MNGSRIAVLVLVALLSPVAAMAQVYFVNELAHGSANNVGFNSSIEVDALGDPHVGYFDVSAARVRYARKHAGVWTLESPDPNAGGDYCSLALNAQGNPAISYFTGVSNDLKYVSKSGVTWTVETADDGGAAQVGFYTSLAFDAQGNPNITYYDLTNGNLKYAKKSGGVWTRETADGSANDVGRHGSLALDAQGNPHVSYRDDTAGDLKYALKIAGAWTTQVVDGAAASVGEHTGIAIDPAGNINVSYYDGTSGSLKYARKSAGVWSTEVVDGGAGLWTSIALDAQGNPHITYQDFVTNDLFYAVKSGGAWTRVAIDAGPNDAALYTSIAFDTQDNPHVSYYDNTTGDLRYATAAVRLVAPAAGVTWAVGSLQNVSWTGVGPVDILLTSDGGRSFTTLLSSISENTVSLRVPHTPSRFGRIRVLRDSPLSSSDTDSFIRIDATIALQKFDLAVTEGEPGTSARNVTLTWETDPAPPTIEGYRLERASSGSSAFGPLHAGLLRAGTYTDTAPADDARYRLVAVNGLGEEYALGERSVAASLSAGRGIAVHPNPAVDGHASVLFRVPFDPRSGASSMPVEVAVFDASGRLVRTLTSGRYATGVQSVSWDGRDSDGNAVAPGTYFARMTAGSGLTASERVVVVR